MRRLPRALLLAALLWLLPAGRPPLLAQVAGTPGEADLVVAGKGPPAVVTVAPDAGPGEKAAAADLAQYVGRMAGVRPALADTPDAVAAALKEPSRAVLIVGGLALEADPSLRDALARVAKPEPFLRADAIALRRKGNRVYVAGNHGDAHAYAVTELLSRWGCRWYLPTEFGECVPRHATLEVGDLDYAYGSPFEVRGYWLAWRGDRTGYEAFMRRNFMNRVKVPTGHSLGKYVKGLVPEGKTAFNVPIADEETARHVAAQLEERFARGEAIGLGLDDGVYQSDSEADRELVALQYDKYFLTQSYTDAFLTFYNRVAELLLEKYPDSGAKIGFLAYSNVTMPPVRVAEAARPLYAYLAPIDIDPVHGMDDPRGGHRREYRDMVYKWAEVMGGRLAIYDYDQGMLVWRDLPSPSHQAFRQDVKHYRKAGILGVDAESRGATGTVFLNLYMRGQLCWDPDFDVDAALAEFYEKFYGPAAGPMARYWGAIFQAWEGTIVSEHEYFVAPAVYTPELLERLRAELEAGEAAVRGLKALSAEDKLYLDRMKFTRLSFEVTDAYLAMVRAAASENDYKKAVGHGERGLAARERLTAMNPTFTSTKMEGGGPAWWPGEVQQYRDLQMITDGTDGEVIAPLPLEWAFRRDPGDVGVSEGWQNQEPDLTWWESQNPDTLSQEQTWEARRTNPGHWEMMRTDLYLQAQGLVTEDYLSYTGHGWYRAEVELSAEQVKGPAAIRFPGLFNECWLYVNGEHVGHREFKGVWWRNDYKFEWDVNLAGKLKPGRNVFVLRINNPHHMGGMFRRPLLYRPIGDPVAKAAERARARADAKAAADAKARAEAAAAKAEKAAAKAKEAAEARAAKKAKAAAEKAAKKKAG